MGFTSGGHSHDVRSRIFGNGGRLGLALPRRPLTEQVILQRRQLRHGEPELFVNSLNQPDVAAGLNRTERQITAVRRGFGQVSVLAGFVQKGDLSRRNVRVSALGKSGCWPIPCGLSQIIQVRRFAHVANNAGFQGHIFSRPERKTRPDQCLVSRGYYGTTATDALCRLR